MRSLLTTNRQLAADQTQVYGATEGRAADELKLCTGIDAQRRESSRDGWRELNANHTQRTSLWRVREWKVALRNVTH